MCRRKKHVLIFKEKTFKIFLFVFQLWFIFKNNRDKNVIFSVFLKMYEKQLLTVKNAIFFCFWPFLVFRLELLHRGGGSSLLLFCGEDLWYRFHETVSASCCGQAYYDIVLIVNYMLYMIVCVWSININIKGSSCLLQSNPSVFHCVF